MEKQGKVAKSAIMLIFFSLISKLLGFLRETLIAYKFGLGSTTDTYFIALSATSMLSGFIMASLNTTFIPIISEVENKEGKQGKVNHTNNMINIMLIFSIGIMIVTYFITPILIKILASGFKGDQLQDAIKLTRLGLSMIVINSVVGIYSGYLESEGLFKSTALRGLPQNLITIFYLIFLSKEFGIFGLMIFSVISLFSTFLIQLPSLKKSGYKYEYKLNFKDKYVNKILKLSLPAFISVAINDLNVIIDKRIASRLVEGSVSALSYADKLNTLILDLFISAITTAIFPSLSEAASRNDHNRLKQILSVGINIIFIITIPATIGIIVLNYQVVELAFERGQFDSMATIMTSNALLYYVLGLTFQSLRLMYEKVFYSLQNTRTPMVTGLIALVLNVIFSLILVSRIGHSGLALGTSISMMISTLILMIYLKKSIGDLGIKSNLICAMKCLIAALIMGISVRYLYGIIIVKSSKFLSLMLSVIVGVFVYGLIIYVLKVDEIRNISDKIDKLMLKKKR